MSLASSAKRGTGDRPTAGPTADSNLRWNFSFGIADGAFFGLFLVLADVNLVMPWLLSQLTSAKWIIGLPPILMMVGASLPQILAAHFVQRYPYRRKVILGVSAIRVSFFVLMLPFLFWEIGGPEVTLVGVLLPYALSSCAVAFAALSWQEMTAKVIPARRLSLYIGGRTFVAGILGLGASQFVGSYLGAVQTVPLPRFGVVLVLATIAIALAMGSNAFVREPPSPVPARIQPLRALVVEAARISWADATFRYYLLARTLLMFSALAAPFYIVEGKTHYGLLADSLGTFAFASVAAGIVASVGWSLLGDRLGLAWLTRAVSALSAVPALLALAMPLIAASPIGAANGWLLVFIAQGAAMTGQQNVNMRGVIELAQPERRALMIGAGNTFCGIVSLAGMLIGVIADTLGAPAAFALAAASTLAVAAFAGLLRPRQPEPVSRALA